MSNFANLIHLDKIFLCDEKYNREDDKNFSNYKGVNLTCEKCADDEAFYQECDKSSDAHEVFSQECESVKYKKRIMIIGCSGSGKTTLSKQISDILNIPIVHLDQIFWLPKWQPMDAETFKSVQKEALGNEAWIVDGNYGGTMDIRFNLADTAIFLDFNRWLCLFRVIKRWIKNYKKTRPDMGNDCPEKIDFEFIEFILGFPKKSKGRIENFLKDFHGKIVILKSPKEVKHFVDKLM